MAFSELKKIKFRSGEICYFNEYTIYFIPVEKLAYGISPIIDKYLDKELKMNDHCITKKGKVAITDKYIDSLYGKKNTILFLVTKTIEKKESVWEDEQLDRSLITKLETLDLVENYKIFNKIRSQLSLRPLLPMSLKRNVEKHRAETIQAIEKKMRNSSGGGFKEATTYHENIISFMFIEKKIEHEYYINLVCTTKSFNFDRENIRSKEYKFPWGTFLLYVLIKSFGSKKINLYNDASGLGILHYHKRFLFNLGNERCHKEDPIYQKSLEIPFEIITPPTESSNRAFSELIDSLPEEYKTRSGYRMKICDIQSDVNVAKINDLERYLELKFNETFNLSKVKVTTNLIPKPKKLLFPLRSSSSSSSSKKKAKKSLSFKKKAKKSLSFKKKAKTSLSIKKKAN